MSNSPLVNHTRISPNKDKNRNHKIDTITIHCVVGQCSVEALGELFSAPQRQASSNYGIGYDGRIGLYVDEADRSWCSSNGANDNRAITIEVASDTTEPYAVTGKAYNALIELCVDICKRNGIERLIWSDNKNDRVNHVNGCNMTCHRDFSNKTCPGTYLYTREGEIAAKVNSKLSQEPKDEYNVGDIVYFKGGKHYVSSTADTGSDATAGEAKIFLIAKGTAHPYSLIKTDGSKSNVYGWVDDGSFEKQQPEKFKVGDLVYFKGANHYTTSNQNNGYPARAGAAKIYLIAEGAKHPYSLIHTEGSQSNVYGWVDEGSFVKLDDPNINLEVGMSVRLADNCFKNIDGKLLNRQALDSYDLIVQKIDGDNIYIKRRLHFWTECIVKRNEVVII